MAKSQGIRKTIEQLIKKVETLENQSFGQKLLIDELEGKLAKAQEEVEKLKNNPFAVNVPYVQTAPLVPPQQVYHVCQPGPTDWTGGSYCTICGAQLTGLTWTVTSTADGTQILGDPMANSSTGVEPTLDLDISWALPEETT